MITKHSYQKIIQRSFVFKKNGLITVTFSNINGYSGNLWSASYIFFKKNIHKLKKDNSNQNETFTWVFKYKVIIPFFENEKIVQTTGFQAKWLSGFPKKNLREFIQQQGTQGLCQFIIIEYNSYIYIFVD